ncbi:MBL fold metallo-hydrolase [Chromatiales bacterium (ex Bugula neritina AB1)]|nr:MBL fold metallo-hydrolase [Chromatiales bacterium (ex Bugula neritina AB1)]
MTPTSDDLWFLPLGGCGEIGMNFNLYGHDGKWLIVDCGLTFSDAPVAPDAPDASSPAQSGNNRNVQMADPQFIVDRAEDIVALIITHAHEDHIGAVQYLWPKLACPVFTTAFTAQILDRKLAETNFHGDVPVHIVEQSDIVQIGPFSVEWIGMAHSVPEPCSLLITTPAARALHSGDWKLDSTPVVGKPFDQQRCEALGNEQIDAIICDSTNATVEQKTPSEAELYPGLKQIIEQASGRVVVTCFGSNLARVATLARIADETDRHLGLLGRSMINMVSAGRATGLLPVDGVSVDPAHLGYLPPETVLLLATGSQGEPKTALNRLSQNSFRDMHLQEGDTVIFSSRVIPGNETSVEALIARLEQLGCHVYSERNSELPIHASGHPSAAELRTYYEWIKPDMLIPVHGEQQHMQANAQIAADAGIPHQLSGENGDLFVIAPEKSIKRSAFHAGRLALQGNKLVPV